VGTFRRLAENQFEAAAFGASVIPGWRGGFAKITLPMGECIVKPHRSGICGRSLAKALAAKRLKNLCE
jgi:hypothetical protein